MLSECCDLASVRGGSRGSRASKEAPGETLGLRLGHSNGEDSGRAQSSALGNCWCVCVGCGRKEAAGELVFFPCLAGAAGDDI